MSIKLLSTRLVVRRFRYKNEFCGFQLLQKEFRVFGIVILRITIDEEDIPVWAEIQMATLGSTDWKSKFVEYIK